MLNTEPDDLDIASFMANLAEAAAKLDPGKREHFIHVMRALVGCYQVVSLLLLFARTLHCVMALRWAVGRVQGCISCGTPSLAAQTKACCS